MTKKFQINAIHSSLQPAYYDQFRCLTNNCQLNCCAEAWKIAFSKKDYLTLKHLSGSPELNERLTRALRRVRKSNSSDRVYGEFDVSSGVCPLLCENGMCALQIEKGAAVQPLVCHVFPRMETPSPFGYLERSLSPACEGVLALLWELPEGIDFIANPLPEEQRNTINFNSAIVHYTQPHEIRSLCIDILQNRRFSLPERLLLLGIALRELADEKDDVPSWLTRTQALLTSPETTARLRELRQAAGLEAQAKAVLQNVHILNSITSKSSAFQDMRKDVVNRLGLPVVIGSGISLSGCSINPLPAYLAAASRFEERFGARGYFLENLMVCVFFHLHMPHLGTPEALWKSYVNLCSLYSFYRFLAVMSCREGAAGDRGELFRLLTHASRQLIHNVMHQTNLRDELFQHDSATLAHMTVLLSI